MSPLGIRRNISTTQGETNIPKTNALIFTIPSEKRMEEAHFYKRKKIPDLIKKLEDAGYKAVTLPDEAGARGFIGSSVYDLLTKLSISGNTRRKALKLLAQIAENNSRWI